MKLLEMVPDHIVVALLFNVLSKVSQPVVNEIGTYLDKLEASAAATKNPYDDFFVGILRGILPAIGFDN